MVRCIGHGDITEITFKSCVEQLILNLVKTLSIV